MEVAKVLIDGEWRVAGAQGTFHAENPSTGETLPTEFPISRWSDCDAALTAAAKAAVTLREIASDKLGAFLDAYASNIDAAADALIAAAHEETGLAVAPRLKDVELPRTTNQLRQAAVAAREGSWRRATLDIERNIRSCFMPIGPVVVFGPNNFPLAFNGVSGGDFAAAIAAGNPVIAKAHPLHPNTTRLLAEEARKALLATGLPPGTLQMIYNISNADGLRLVSDARVGAIGFTGSRGAGLALKKAADEAGKPMYAEMSSLNPVIFLPGAIAEREEQLARELTDSCMAGSGQFCTSPNLILIWENAESENFVKRVEGGFSERVPQTLLSAAGREHIRIGVDALVKGGAQIVTGGSAVDGVSYRFANTLLRATGKQFLARPVELQREVFGNVALIVSVSDERELSSILHLLEGNLTGTIYSAKSGDDDAVYSRIEPLLLSKVGRILNDKMPTGVAVSSAMNHGGPYPATSHAGFTSVGIPASLTRFAQLRCYDAVREERLPDILRNVTRNPLTWRLIDGAWTRG
jgi:alpha-ketoglutaric semialdehyde dehydrogenase